MNPYYLVMNKVNIIFQLIIDQILNLLHKNVMPFIMRRNKQDVLHDLP